MPFPAVIPILAGLWKNPLARKVAIGLAALAVISYAFLWYGARREEKGKAKTRAEVTAEVEASKQAEWAIREAEIEAGQKVAVADRVAAAADRKAAEADRKDAALARQAANEALIKQLSTIQGKWEAERDQARNVPADRIDDAIRALLAELAAADRK